MWRGTELKSSRAAGFARYFTDGDAECSGRRKIRNACGQILCDLPSVHAWLWRHAGKHQSLQRRLPSGLESGNSRNAPDVAPARPIIMSAGLTSRGRIRRSRIRRHSIWRMPRNSNSGWCRSGMAARRFGSDAQSLETSVLKPEMLPMPEAVSRFQAVWISIALLRVWSGFRAQPSRRIQTNLMPARR
jgi:hypothetical protein